MPDLTIDPQEPSDLEVARALIVNRSAEIDIEPRALLDGLVEADKMHPTAAARLLAADDWREQLEAGRQERRARWAEWLAEAFLEAVAGVMPSAIALGSEGRLALMAPALKQWATGHDPSTGALVMGLSGSGKTVAVVELADRLLRQDADAAWEDGVRRRKIVFERPRSRLRGIRAASLGAYVEFGLVKGSFGWRESVPLLAIDDLGWETPATVPAVRELLAVRYAAGLPTIVTSGCTLPELRERYGDAVVRRIVEARGQRGPVIDLHPPVQR